MDKEKKQISSEVNQQQVEDFKWQSLEQWENSPAFQKQVENEFLSSPLSEADAKSPVARRDFLKLMGASLALSSAGCIRRPVQKIIPYVQRPKDVVLGVANYYTSTLLDAGVGYGVIVKTREGRPIKVDGNPEFPMNKQGLSARGQAHVLSLYDPDRLRSPKKNLHNEKRTNRDTIDVSWEKANSEISKKLKEGKVAILTSTLASPSLNSVVAEFLSKTNGKHYVWDSLSATEASQSGCFDLSNAKLVVSIGADFLGTFQSPTEYGQQWGKGRKPVNGEMNRLVTYESMMSLTGANSDERFMIKPSEQLDVALALIEEISKAKGRDSKIKPSSGFDKKSLKIAAIAEELIGKKGVVLSGGINTQTEDFEALQEAVAYINSLLGHSNYDSQLLTSKGSQKQLKSLIAEINSGKIKNLVIHKANPSYFMGQDKEWLKALQNLDLIVYAGDLDETGQFADYVLPADHEMESWGDAEFKPGLYAIQQPTITPLYDTRSFGQMLLDWSKEVGSEINPSDWYGYIRDHWKNKVIGNSNFDQKWDDALQKGMFERRRGSQSRIDFSLDKIAKSNSRNSGDYEVVLYQKIGLGDGRYANLPWLQELPDPVTKVVWDNYVNVSPATAKKLNLELGDVVELSVGEKKVKIPVHIQPGLHDHVLALAVGYGRTKAGRVAEGVGVNAFELIDHSAEKAVFSGLPGKIKKAKGKVEIACTQGHHSLEGRPLVATTTLKEFNKNPKAGHYKPHFEGSIWEDHQYKGHKWGMVIDMNSCNGCSACVVACQAENNIPVVGKKYVLQGREMHWLRIDRYYSGQPKSPDTVHQVMICQHCDNAPCETVCPVVATSHSSEGINEMTYNRCVGTRYCANNCPYKVRRFNWFSYLNYREPSQMVLNPEVTVRSRGVMEKCSFCVQRIKERKNVAKDEGRALKDGEIKVACQQSCGADAIMFGDVNDPESKVSQWMKKKQAYSVLEDLNTKPAIRYLTKIRNREPIKTEHGEGHH